MSRAGSICALLLCAWGASPPAAAVPVFRAMSDSRTQVIADLRLPDQAQPIDEQRSGCRDGVCHDLRAEADPGHVGAAYTITGAGAYSENAWVSARAAGLVTVLAPPGDIAAYADVMLRLQFDGGVSLPGPGAFGETGYDVSVLTPLSLAREIVFVATDRRVHFSSQNFDLSLGDATDIALLRVPLGRPFELSLFVRAEVHGNAGSELLSSAWSLGLIDGLPVFEFASPGYSVQSADFAIVDNRFCPQGCAALPEPPTWVLLALALLALRTVHAPGA